MNRVTQIALSLCGLVLVSCSTKSYPVSIISNPPGARIEVNDNYVGDTPLTLSIKGHGDRRFTETTTIKATPKNGGYITPKTFFAGHLNDARIPEKIFFQ